MRQHEAWLIKAEHDLRSAKKLSSGKHPLNDTAIYHTQQCGEKSLKAFLTFHAKPIQKSHDLEFLIENCEEIDPSFSDYHDIATELTPYATAFRYPDMVMVPEATDVSQAIKSAEKLFNFVRSKIVT